MRPFLLLVALALPASAAERLTYQFDQVRSKVVLASASEELAAHAGLEAHGGDRIRTGWRGQATIREASRGARFEIHPATQVRLAEEIPGVLLELERGRLKAFFEAVTGNEPRIVKTPGALLAVRGTRYGVEATADGRTLLTVFEGAVEVHSDVARQPLLVTAGHMCEYGRNQPPRSAPMPHGMSEDRWDRHGHGRSGPEGMRPPEGAPADRGRGMKPESSPPSQGGMHHPGSTPESGRKPHGG